MLALATRECKLWSGRSLQSMTTAAPSTRDTILVVASQRFAERGFSGTSLADIADEVGIRPPSLFHHFPSKVALYRAVLLDAFDDWFALMDDTAAVEADEGWPQVERVIRTAFRFFVERPDFVRLARWEALEGGSVLVEELAMVLRPLFERGALFLEGEMDAGRIRRCDARRLVITGYGAVLSYLSDAPLVGSLLGEDPTSPEALEVEQDHILDLFRHALEPHSV
jgi:TetR/AcrR family transcriptional regulator